MKSVLTGSLAAVVIAFLSSFILGGVQKESYVTFTGNGASINSSEVGNNLVGKDFNVKAH